MATFSALLAFTTSAAHAAQPSPTIQVLRAEANGPILDVLLRVQLPDDAARHLRPSDFAAYIAPEGLPPAKAATPQYRLRRLFVKRLGNAYYLDLRQLPAGVGATACQLVLQIAHEGHRLATHRLPRLLEPPAEELDVALLIDESLSMLRTDPEKLRLEAAKTFVDLARRSTRIGHIALIGFNTRARTLAPLTSPAQPQTLYKAIERVRAMDQTDIDAALNEAHKVFAQSTTPAKAIVLLTDGKDEPGRYENAHRHFAAAHTRIYTVGLSKRADTRVLQRIALDTGGEYHEAPTNAELQDIFGRICLALQKKVPIRSRRLALRTATLARDPFPVDDSISALTISLKARDPDVAFALVDPAARRLAPHALQAHRSAAYNRKAAYQYYDLWSPAPGAWAAELKAPRPARVTVAAAAVTPLLLRAFPVKPTTWRGEPIELAASLAIADSILAHPRVEARITTADGTVTTLPLLDDGEHHDTDPDDGVFAGLFPGSEASGPCTIRLVASGTTPEGNRFERELDLTTTISAEGHSKLWCATRVIDFGVLYTGDRASRSFDLKLTSALDTRVTEPIRTTLPPLAATRAAASAQARFPATALRITPNPIRLETGRLAPIALALAVPTAQAAGHYRTQLGLASKYDQHTIPIQVEVRRPALALSPKAIDLGTIESGSKADATVSIRLEPRGTATAQATSPDARLTVSPAALSLGPKPTALRVTLTAPADLATTTIRTTLVVRSPLGTSTLPVTAKVVKPAFTASPAAIDFGQLKPGDTAQRPLTLRIEGLQPRKATFATTPLAGPKATPPLPLAAPAPLALTPGKDTAATLALAVPPAQPPGAYRGTVTVATPLGTRTLSTTARVEAIHTIRPIATIDFGRVPLGTTAERTLDLQSLIAADQKVVLTLPPPAADWRLAAAPTTLSLPAKGKGRLTLRLTAAPDAAPGTRTGTVTLRGPSQGTSFTVRADLFRPPHRTVAFAAPVLDIGRVVAGTVRCVDIGIRSLIDAPQHMVVERIDAPKGVTLEASPTRSTLAAGAMGILSLRVVATEPKAETAFDGAVVVRGRSLPATLRVRGVVVPSARPMLALEPTLLDFGSLEPGTHKSMLLTLASRSLCAQDVRFADSPALEGLTLALPTEAMHLPPGIELHVPIQLGIDGDASLGERTITCEVRGPGQPATFQVRVEVAAPVPPPMPPPIVAGSEPEGIGWAEGLAILLLLILLLAVLVAAWLLGRWLIRTQRMPRMAKYFALSALVHAAVLFTALDLFIARQVQEKKLGPTFKVGLKAVAGAFFSSQQASAADTLRAQRESERRVEAKRQQRAAEQRARTHAQAEQRRLDPAQATLDRPKPNEKPKLAATPPDTTKHSVEDLTRLLETVREAEKLRSVRQQRPDEAVQTRADKTARLRTMSRAELEAAVRKAMEPKAAASDKPTPAAAPATPGLASPQLAHKAALKLDDLAPALEDLKQELAKGKADAKGGGPTAQHVGAERKARGAAVERQAAEGERVAMAGPRGIGQAARATPDHAAAAALPAAPQAPSPTGKAAAPSLDLPNDLAPAVEGTKQHAAASAPSATGPAAQHVGVSRPLRAATASRATGRGGPRVATASAQPGARNAPLSASRPGAAMPLAPMDVPAQGRQAAPLSFAAPDEKPAVDPHVRLPGGKAVAAPEAAPMPMARRSGGGSTAPVARPTMSAGRARVAVGQPLATPDAPGRSRGGATRLPTAATGSAPAQKAAPRLDDFVLVEGPLVAPRQSETGSSRSPGPRTVVARWSLRTRPDARTGLTAAATAGTGTAPMAPRDFAAARPSQQAAPLAEVGAPASQPKPAPALDGVPAEQVNAQPGVAQAPAHGQAAAAGEAAAPVGVARASGEAHVERGAMGASEHARHTLDPRASVAAPGVPRGEALLGALGALVAEQGRRVDAPLAQGAPEESVESAPLVAARSTAPGLAERSVAPPSVPRGAREAGHDRRDVSPRETPRHTLTPRAMATTRSKGRVTSRLLMPGIERAAAGAGAVVGSETGGATDILLTTVRYGSGEVDWDTHKTAMPFLAWQLREHIGFNIETRVAEVPLESPKVMKSPWVFMSGHKDFRFTAAQVDSLRRYLLGGGTLWADDSTHETDFTWDKAFRREIARVLPPDEGHSLRKITKADNHAIFRSCFDLSDGYAGYFPPPGDKYRQNHIEGIEIDGRLAVVYTRNDYGDGLEIKPDTFPLKASLSGLSPAEMQESSFLMASNIIVYILTGGHGLADRGLLARAADSLRRRRDARRNKVDAFADAPATVFDDFAEDNWEVETEWEQAAPAKLTYTDHADADAAGRRLEVAYTLGRADSKVVLIRDMPEELDARGHHRCYVDLDSKVEGGARVSLALITLPKWKYFESRPAFIRPGRNRVYFDLRAATWKTGEPVPEGKSEYSRPVGNPQSVRRFVLLLYPVGRRGTVVLDRIEFRTKP